MTKFGIGQAVRRVEDQRFLMGTGNYVGDIDLPRQCYAVSVFSTHAHADIKSVDASLARAAGGVLLVLTSEDVTVDGIGGIPPHFMPEAWGGPKGFATIRPLLVGDRVRCVGERIAFVVAETEDQARDAAELVKVDYAPLPAVVTIEDAIRPDARRIWDECPAGNIGVTIAMGDADATQAAFRKAAHKVPIRVRNNRVTACAMEPRAAVGRYDAAGGAFELYTTSQDPHGVRSNLASHIFHVPETRIRVVSPDVGGGFGMKSNLYPEDGLVLWASKRCGRPVKWIASRAESLVCDTHARDQIVEGEIALDAAGKILAVRVAAHQALGAYWWAAITAPLFFSLMLIPSVYDIPAMYLTTNAVFTNTTPTSVYRGAGRPEAIYFIERMLDEAAAVTGIDRVKLRQINMIRPGQLPYHTQTHQNYDSGDFPAMLDRCLALIDWDGFAARKAESKARGRLRGRAVTPYIEIGGVFNERMELRFDPSGMVTIIAGTHSHGQGHATAFAQLVSQWLGVPFEDIRYLQGDTEVVGYGRGTFAARSSMVGGVALRQAADAVIEKARKMAGVLLEAAEKDIAFADGVFSVAGTDKKIPLQAVAKVFFAPAGPVLQFGLGLEGAGSFTGAPGGPPNYPNGCQACEVEIDPETGKVDLVRFAAIDDLGMIINPMICEGQIHGGLAQGIGQALLEDIVFDRSDGQLLSGSFMDYGVPRADDLPSILSDLVEIPAKTNPLGIKGIGESGTIGAPPTVVNAALDALRTKGVKHLDMPLTPSRVWRAIRAAGQDAA